MRHKLLRLASASSILLALAGCQTFQQANALTDQTNATIASNAIPAPSVVDTVSDSYLLGSVVDVVDATPAVLNQHITLMDARPQSINDIASQISELTGIPVEVDGLSGGSSSQSEPSLPVIPASVGGLPPPPSALFGQAAQGSDAIPHVSIRYSGELHGLFDAVASEAGLSWRFKDGSVTFFKTESQTFDIPALAWATTSQSDIVASAGAETSSVSSSGGSSGTATSSSGDTSIENTSTTDVWKGLEATAKTVSGGALISTDPSSGTITVTGTPDQVEQVAQWVQGLTDTLSKQVAVTIQVYNVSVNNEQNYGFSPALAFASAAKTYGLSVSGAGAPAVQGSAAPFSFGASILNSASGAASQLSGSTAAVQALATLGHVTQVFSRSIVTLNGQPSPIQVAQQTGYLASSSSTSTANVGTSTGLTPGTVTTGFTGTIFPRIVGNKILLGMNMTISELEALNTVSSGGSSIQVPTTSDTVVSQSAALQSGSTLMITGFQEQDANTTANGVGSPYFPALGGGQDADLKKNVIAIVVTARTL